MQWLTGHKIPSYFLTHIVFSPLKKNICCGNWYHHIYSFFPVDIGISAVSSTCTSHNYHAWQKNTIPPSHSFTRPIQLTDVTVDEKHIHHICILTHTCIHAGTHAQVTSEQTTWCNVFIHSKITKDQDGIDLISTIPPCSWWHPKRTRAETQEYICTTTVHKSNKLARKNQEATLHYTCTQYILQWAGSLMKDNLPPLWVQPNFAHWVQPSQYPIHKGEMTFTASTA